MVYGSAHTRGTCNKFFWSLRTVQWSLGGSNEGLSKFLFTMNEVGLFRNKSFPGEIFLSQKGVFHGGARRLIVRSKISQLDGFRILI